MMENYSVIISSIAILGGIGLACGILLLIASKIFSVEVDERVTEIVKMLPGANCGACGFAGCARFAKDIMERRTSPNICRVIDDEKSAAIATFLGIEIEKCVRMVATLRCQGGDQIVSRRSEYHGIASCRAVSVLGGGDKACTYGCLGYGDCVEVCLFEAIRHGENGLIVIDGEKCAGCGQCTEECPQGILVLTPSTAQVFIACSSKDRGKRVSQVCEKGCIACRKCEKACTLGAITVEDNLVCIDYEKCDDCGQCVEACPTGSLVRV